MNNNNSIKIWAQEAFPNAIQLAPFKNNKLASKIALYVFIAFFILLGSMLVYGYFEPKSAESPNIYVLLFGIFLILFPFGVKFFVQNIQNNFVNIMDRNGITTKNGKFHAWETLQKIHFQTALNKSDFKTIDTYTIAFHFKGGKSTVTFHFPDFKYILHLVNQLNVPKTSSLNAYSRSY